MVAISRSAEPPVQRVQVRPPARLYPLSEYPCHCSPCLPSCSWPSLSSCSSPVRMRRQSRAPGGACPHHGGACPHRDGAVKSVLWRGRPPPPCPVTVLSAARPAGACGTNRAPPQSAPTSPNQPTVQPPRIRPTTRPTPDRPPRTTGLAPLTRPHRMVRPAVPTTGLSSPREFAPTPRHRGASGFRSPE